MKFLSEIPRRSSRVRFGEILQQVISWLLEESRAKISEKFIEKMNEFVMKSFNYCLKETLGKFFLLISHEISGKNMKKYIHRVIPSVISRRII